MCLELQCIIMKGRADSDQWVTTFIAGYGHCGQSPSLDHIYDPDTGGVMMFTGPSDRHTPVAHRLPPNTVGSCVQIQPAFAHVQVAFRVEIIARDIP